MVAANYSIAHYAMGFMLGLKAFTAAVLGGIGNIGGAMLGGLLLGVIESWAPATSAISPAAFWAATIRMCSLSSCSSWCWCSGPPA
jgi:branched-subunit amino acid ABC-type transport system permease component